MAGLREFEIEGEIGKKGLRKGPAPGLLTKISLLYRHRLVLKPANRLAKYSRLGKKKTYNIGNGATRARNKIVEMLRDRLIRKQRSTKLTGFLSE